MLRTLLVSASLIALLPACTDPCVELGEKICECESVSPTSYDADQCKVELNKKASLIEISDEAQDRCEQLLDGCRCDALDTAEGKQACGLAVTP